MDTDLVIALVFAFCAILFYIDSVKYRKRMFEEDKSNKENTKSSGVTPQL